MTPAFEAAVYSSLTGHAGLAALIGARLFPDFVPAQKDKVLLPALIYTIDYENDPQLGDPMGANTGTLSFEVYAERKADVLNVCIQLRAACHALTGTQAGDQRVRHCTFARTTSTTFEEAPDKVCYGALVEFRLMLDSAA